MHYSSYLQIIMLFLVPTGYSFLNYNATRNLSRLSKVHDNNDYHYKQIADFLDQGIADIGIHV